MNLEIEGVSIGVCFWNWLLQINIRSNAWEKYPSSVDLVKANAISAKIQSFFGSSPDAPAIVRAFDSNRWLRELTSRGIDDTYYGLRVIRDVTQDVIRSEKASKEGPAVLNLSSSSDSSDVFLDGLG